MDDHSRSFYPNTTQIPNYFLDFLCQDLTESELRVALYILRRIYGFQKQGDAIALSQLVDGITRRDGTRLDRGTGLSKSSVVRGVKGLEARGLLHVRRTPGDKKHAAETTFYSLAMGLLSSGADTPPDGSAKLKQPLSQIASGGSANGAGQVVPNLDPQNLDQNKVTKESDQQFIRRHVTSRHVPPKIAAQLVARHTHDGKLDRDRFMAALPKG